MLGVSCSSFIFWPVCLCVSLCRLASSYNNFPYSPIRHTGGTAFGTVSIKSSPLLCASRSASVSDITPSCCLASSITRTSRARIFPLRLCFGSREGNEREGNGLNKTPFRFQVVYADLRRPSCNSPLDL